MKKVKISLKEKIGITLMFPAIFMLFVGAIFGIIVVFKEYLFYGVCVISLWSSVIGFFIITL